MGASENKEARKTRIRVAGPQPRSYFSFTKNSFLFSRPRRPPASCRSMAGEDSIFVKDLVDSLSTTGYPWPALNPDLIIFLHKKRNAFVSRPRRPPASCRPMAGEDSIFFKDLVDLQPRAGSWSTRILFFWSFFLMFVCIIELIIQNATALPRRSCGSADKRHRKCDERR